MFRKWILISLSLILCASLPANVHEGYPQTINTINQAYFDGVVVGPGDLDLNGNLLILDADGDSWFDPSVDDDLSLTLGNGSIMTFDQAEISSDTVGSFNLKVTSGASNSPVFRFRGDTNTGIWGSGDILYLIAGAQTAYQVKEDTNITHIRSGLTTRFTSETVADDAEISIATGVSGWGECMAGNNEAFAHFTFTEAGIVTLYSDVGSVVNIDTDGNLCIYQNGTSDGINIKNRLGSSKIIAFRINYK
jgi:hypothetical protein